MLKFLSHATDANTEADADSRAISCPDIFDPARLKVLCKVVLIVHEKTLLVCNMYMILESFSLIFFFRFLIMKVIS